MYLAGVKVGLEHTGKKGDDHAHSRPASGLECDAFFSPSHSHIGLNIESLLQGAVETENGVTSGCTLPLVYQHVTC